MKHSIVWPPWTCGQPEWCSVFFAGLTHAEAARELGISLGTAERVWEFARSWLLREMQKQTTGTEPEKPKG